MYVQIKFVQVYLANNSRRFLVPVNFLVKMISSRNIIFYVCLRVKFVGYFWTNRNNFVVQ